MNKLFTKIVGAALGATMAIGVGVAVASNQTKSTQPVLAEESLYKAVTFTADKCTTGTNGYTGTAVYTFDDFVLNCANFNNYNKGWDVIKCGRKKPKSGSGASVASIITDEAIEEAITSVSVTIDAIDASHVNSIKLYSSANGTTWSAESTQFSKSTGEQKVSLSSSSANKYYKVEFDCAQGSNNGFVTVSGISYYFEESTPVTDWELNTDSLTIDPLPTNTTYYSDDDDSDIDLTGATITAHYVSHSDSTKTKTKELELSDVTATLNKSGANSTINLSYTDAEITTAGYRNSQTGSFAITLNDGPRPLNVLFDATAQGYGNQEVVESWTDSSNYVTITFDKGTNSNAPKYFTTGTAIRCYGGNTLTISSETKNIVGVTMTFASGEDSNSISSNPTGWTEPTWSGETGSVVFTISGSSGHRRIQTINITYAEKEVVVPTKAVVSFKSNDKTYYNGSYTGGGKTFKFSTNDISVVTQNDSGKEAASYTSGTGFILTLNNQDYDARETVQEIILTGWTATSYPIIVTVKGVGAGDSDVTNSTQTPAVNLVVNNKEASSLTWNNEQTGSFVSFADKLHIDGTFNATYTDGSSNVANENITTRVYTGSSAVENNMIYSQSKTYNTHKNGFDITNEVLLEGKTIEQDSEGRLAYSTPTTFYVEMYVTAFPQVKIGKTVNVVIPVLYAEDANSFNYYVGTQYNTAVKNVSLKYNSQVVRELGSSDVTLNPSSVKPLNTNPITVTVTFSATESFNITTTYNIVPKEPAQLEAMELYDQDGAKMTDGSSTATYVAGEDFHLYNKAGENYFAYVLDEDVEEYFIDSYADFDFELLESASSESGVELTTETFMRIRMNNKYVRATYTQGSSSISFTFQLSIANATVEEYTPASYGDYEKVTSTGDVTTGQYLIVYETGSVAFDGSRDDSTGGKIDAANNTVGVTIVDGNKIVATDAMNDASFAITSVTGGFTIAAKGGCIDQPSYANGLSFNDGAVNTITISGGNAIISGTGASGSSHVTLKYNKDSGQTRFRYYKSGQEDIQLYKRKVNGGKGDVISYLKSYIDANRINNDTDVIGEGISICNAATGIYGTAGWTKAKEAYLSLTESQKTSSSGLGVQDKFGKLGKTYNDTYLMLLAKDPASDSSNLISNLFKNNVGATTVVIVTSAIALTAIGGYFFIRRRKHN